MKYLFFYFNFFCVTISMFGQETPYYDNHFKKNIQRTVNLPNTEVTQQRLYFGLEGNFRISSTTINNPNIGYFAKAGNNDVGWSAYVGYNNDHKWAVELAYTPTPVQTSLLMRTRLGVINFTSGNTLASLPIRYKRNIFTLDRETKTASIWVGGGIVISPNSRNESTGSLTIPVDLANVKVGPNQKVISADTIKLSANGYTLNKSLFQLEGSVELLGRIADGFYINLFWRGVIGQDSFARTDFNYSVANKIIDSGNIYTNGFYYNFGLGLRYDFNKSLKYKSKLAD